VRSWEELATLFEHSADIRRLIYRTSAIEGYKRYLRHASWAA